jgi:acetate kinase
MVKMKILVCNAGSTSLKFKLYELPECTILAQCKIERVGSKDDGIFSYENLVTGKTRYEKNVILPEYRTGVDLFLACLVSSEWGVISNTGEIDRVGFKTTLSKGYFGVHELTDDVLDGMRAWLPLAALHNTAYIEAIETMRGVLPGVMFIGVFEPGFHQSIPLARKLYGVPWEWYKKYGVQRLGYHGASHGYIADVLNKKGGSYKAISCHLGGSSSVCAIENGTSIDTSFGMGLQSGLIHATRTGDMDCDLFEFLHNEGLSDAEIHDGFVNKGGLLGISGISGDMRYIEAAAEKGNERAVLAIDVFVNGIAHYIGAFFVDLGGLDYLVFTAGIGEKSPLIRRLVCEKLAVLGVGINNEKNKNTKGYQDISAEKSRVAVLVIPTDEELGIARRTFEYEN